MSLLTAIAIVSFVAAPVPKADPAKEAMEAIQGEWKMVTFIKDGSERKQDADSDRIIIKGDKLTIRERGRDEVTTITIDHKAEPKTIDIKVVEGKREVLIKGIYKLDKDKLTLCFALEERDRPKEFKSEADSNVGLMVLERVKK